MFNFESAWLAADTLYTEGKRAESRRQLLVIAAESVEADNVEDIHCKELAVYRLAEILCLEKQPEALVDLLTTIRPFFAVLPKAKTTKIVRKIFDQIFAAGATLDEQIRVCDDMIAWSRIEKRTFLRHRLQHRLALVQHEKSQARDALTTINALLKEVRRLDDRSLLVDIHLLESKVYYSIKNISKARAALVSARTNANAIYCPPLAQAEIDLQSGVLHADEGDAKTAYSYLFESFEGFHTLGDHAKQARTALRYMILAKIATDQPDELAIALSAKNVLEYAGRDMDALRGIASAYKAQDTHAFNSVLQGYNDVLSGDEIIHRQLRDMYNALLEKHLTKIIAPYNRVQVAYIAELLKLPADVVEARVSQMILDKKLCGIVDQQQNCLVVFEDIEKKSKVASLYKDALDTLEHLDKLVSTLFDKVAGKFDRLVEQQLEKRNKKKIEDEASKKKRGGKEEGDKEKKDKKEEPK